MATKLELQTVPGSGIGTIAILLGVWERVAKEVDRLVEPLGDELIFWRVFYNRHVETEEEFEETECPPVPIMFARVSLIVSETLWQIRQYEHAIQFCCCEVMIVSSDGKLLDCDEGSVIREIADALRQKSEK